VLLGLRTHQRSWRWARKLHPHTLRPRSLYRGRRRNILSWLGALLAHVPRAWHTPRSLATGCDRGPSTELLLLLRLHDGVEGMCALAQGAGRRVWMGVDDAGGMAGLRSQQGGLAVSRGGDIIQDHTRGHAQVVSRDVLRRWWAHGSLPGDVDGGSTAKIAGRTLAGIQGHSSPTRARATTFLCTDRTPPTAVPANVVRLLLWANASQTLLAQCSSSRHPLAAASVLAHALCCAPSPRSLFSLKLRQLLSTFVSSTNTRRK
jgi:hypothetical protein